MYAEMAILMQHLTKGLIDFMLHGQSVTVPAAFPCHRLNTKGLTGRYHPSASGKVRLSVCPRVTYPNRLGQ